MITIYVDGSWHADKVGYGVVILENEEIKIEFSGRLSDEFVQGTRQVAGEIYAVGKAIQWCQRNNVTEATIYYDYMGVEMWATKKWKANLNLTQRYRDFMLTCGIKITWVKVKSHSGDKWNDYADKLAKQHTGAK